MPASNLQNGLMISGMHLQQYHSLQTLSSKWDKSKRLISQQKEELQLQ
jgi:hypothetical protein